MGIPEALFVLQAISAVKSFVDTSKAAKAQKSANAAAMAAAEKEAQIVREDAEDAALEEKRAAAVARGQQIAQFLQSGVTLDGSPLLVTSETTAKGEKSAQAIIDTAEARAEALLLQGAAGQKPVTQADIFGTGATILGAAGDAGFFK